MRYGLHTAFDGTLGVDLLRELVGMRYTLHRVEVTHVPNETMVAMVREAVDVGALPLVVVWETGRLPFLGGFDAEWKNELDGDIPPAEYRRELDDAVQMAVAHGVRLWGGVISNLDADSLKWLNDVKGDGWPAGLHGVTAHRYGDGTFENPHTGFSSRDAEVKWLRAAAAGLPIQITEFGYPDTDLTEQQCAERIAQEWDFWMRHQIPAYLYQLSDGPGPGPVEHMGIRRIEPDGSWAWKPCALVVPQSNPINPPEEIIDMQPTEVIHRRDLIPLGNGKFACRYPPGASDTVMSVQPDGRIETRPANAVGAWETVTDDGTRAVFEDVDGKAFAFPLVG